MLFPGRGRLLENCVLSINNKSHTVTANIVVPEQGGEGVIVCQGANIGGWSLYMHEGSLKYCYNYGGFGNTFVTSAEKLAPGEHPVQMDFAYAGDGLGKGGTVTLSVDANPVGQGELKATLSNIYSADDGLDVGEDSGAPVSPDYGPVGNHFNGEIKGVQLSIAEGDAGKGRLVRPEDAVRAMFGRQ